MSENEFDWRGSSDGFDWRDFDKPEDGPDKTVAFEGMILELGIGSLFVYIAPDHVRYSEPFDMLDDDDRAGVAKVIAAEVMRDLPEHMHETLFETFVDSLANIAQQYRMARELRNRN